MNLTKQVRLMFARLSLLLALKHYGEICQIPMFRRKGPLLAIGIHVHTYVYIYILAMGQNNVPLLATLKISGFMDVHSPK